MQAHAARGGQVFLPIGMLAPETWLLDAVDVPQLLALITSNPREWAPGSSKLKTGPFAAHLIVSDTSTYNNNFYQYLLERRLGEQRVWVQLKACGAVLRPALQQGQRSTSTPHPRAPYAPPQARTCSWPRAASTMQARRALGWQHNGAAAVPCQVHCLAHLAWGWRHPR